MKKLPKGIVRSLTRRLVTLLPCYLVVSLVLLTTVYWLLFTASPASAANFDTTLEQFQKGLAPGQDYNKESFDLQTIVGVSGGLLTLLAGCTSPTCPSEIKVGAAEQVGTMIAGLYSIPPASGVYYALDVAKRLNPVRPAYAQDVGVGFSVLRPFLEIWRAVRNVVYVLFVIGAIILGFSIMFRTKISPQVVMTIQAALPRLVMGLLLVTFSYAIVGLLIDLTYVFIGVLMLGIGAGNLQNYNASQYFSDYVNANFGTTTLTVFSRGLGGAWDIFRALSSNLDLAAIGVVGGLLTIIIAVISFMLAGPIGAAGALQAIAAPLIPVVLGLVIAFVGFLLRILFNLAKAYLILLIHLILGPVFIFWGALSGGGVWNSWLRPVLANLLVFPAVGIVIFLADVMINQIEVAVGARPPIPIWGPPYLGRQEVILKGMIGIGAVLLLAQIPDIINQIFRQLRVPVEGPDLGRRFGGVGQDIFREFQRLRQAAQRG